MAAAMQALAAVMLFGGLGAALTVGVDLLVTSYREGPRHRGR